LAVPAIVNDANRTHRQTPPNAAARTVSFGETANAGDS
jgi:hypothetical protein